jgi:predicted RNA-binding protein with PIN domain
MARTFLLIDGYNLLHAAGLARRRYGPGEFQRVRSRLQQLLRDSLNSEVLADSVTVFDSNDSGSEANETAVPGECPVRFSTAGRDADAEIEYLLSVHSSPRQVVIVSSDRRLQTAASRKNAGWIDSEDFLRVLNISFDAGGSARMPKSMGLERQFVEDDRVHPPTARTDSEIEQHFLQTDVDAIRRSERDRER